MAATTTSTTESTAGWTPLHARLHQTLRDRALLPKGQGILIAVSGGQDSLCLAKLLLDLQPKWQWQLALAHCDHGWRVDSQANAAYVEELATTWKLPYHLRVADRPLVGEAAARQWRYESLGEIAQAVGYSYITTGHTASDRAETLLYNLVRGSGADGLQALTWQRPLVSGVQLVRPLLNFQRQETGQFCQTVGLAVWEDSTNQDQRYVRNRIRAELLPYLKTQLNPQAEIHLAQTAELLSAEVEYLEQAATQLRQAATRSQPNLSSQAEEDRGVNSHLGTIDRALLKSAPLALQRRALRQWLDQALPHPPDFNQVEKLLNLLDAPNRSRTDPFPGGAIAEVRGAWLYLLTLPD